MADQLFSTSPYGKALFNAYGSRRPTIAVLGDSYGEFLAAAIQYACAKLYPADIHFDHRTPENGGRLFSVGGSFTTALAGQVAQFQANPADVVFIWSGYNNAPSNRATALANAGDITSAATTCLAAGAKLVVLCGQTAKYTCSTWSVETLNTMVQVYARATPGVMFLETTPVMADPTSAAVDGIPFRGGNAVFGGYVSDGVHPSAHAVRAGLAPLIVPVLERIARRRSPRAAINAGWYDRADSPELDLLYNAGNMLGTGGSLSGSANSNVAGDAGTAAWAIAVSGGVTATPSLVIGADGFRRQRITFGGSGTSGAYCLIECSPIITNVNNGDTSRLYDTEAVIDLAGVTGLQDVIMNAGGVISANPTGGVSNAAHRYADGTTERLFLYGLYPRTINGNNPLIRFTFYFTNGQSPAGYVDIGRVSCRKVA